jgi:hypothetical protein
MIIDINEKFDVSPEWFEEQAGRDRWCQLLSVYKVKDEAGAKLAAEKMIAAGVSEKLIKIAME